MDSRNRVVAWPDDKANSSKKPLSLNKVVVGALNNKNAIVSNRTNMKQKTNFGNSAIIRVDELGTKDKIITEASNKQILEIKIEWAWLRSQILKTKLLLEFEVS